MPNIQIMNWNIEKLSQTKINVPGMADALARTVHAANVDILCIVELVKNNPAYVMTTLSAALNGLAGGNDWQGWFYSYHSGEERYGYIIRNMDLIRPVMVENPLPPNEPFGTQSNPMIDLQSYRFQVWPHDFPAGTAYPLPGGARPKLPLMAPSVEAVNPRRAKGRKHFAGDTIANGGYSLGRGYRQPCLGLFKIHTPAGNDYFVPIIACHYAAVRSSRTRNHLSQAQVAQLKLFNICQLFYFYNTQNDVPANARSNYINIGAPGAPATRIQELVFLGDYNLDFQTNNAVGSNIAVTNHQAYSALTPKSQGAGSGPPPVATPAPVIVPVPNIPVVPMNVPFQDEVPDQALRAAVTNTGTILVKVPAAPVVYPPPYTTMRGAAFDNFIYGGTRLATAPVMGGGDSGQIVNLPLNLRTAAPAAAAEFDVAPIAAYYAAQPNQSGGFGVKFAQFAPGLIAGAVPNSDERLIGTRLVSDHLPVILQFFVP